MKTGTAIRFRYGIGGWMPDACNEMQNANVPYSCRACVSPKNLRVPQVRPLPSRRPSATASELPLRHQTREQQGRGTAEADIAWMREAEPGTAPEIRRPSSAPVLVAGPAYIAAAVRREAAAWPARVCGGLLFRWALQMAETEAQTIM
jgi:hypothetical protein